MLNKEFKALADKTVEKLSHELELLKGMKFEFNTGLSLKSGISIFFLCAFDVFYYFYSFFDRFFNHSDFYF